ncbi:dynamin family protein [Diaphorobacter sp.]|uniref:dynamin family protein n=1 Tax=Diaphorobacter sp. TaxID=1934310 RepID=UPI0028AE8949|nr:dynamin family protein [Diaphorobacter sp.]
MTKDTYEQQFIATVHASAISECNLQPIMERMQHWQAQLLRLLHSAPFEPHGLLPESALARQVRVIHAGAEQLARRWPAQWAALQPAQSLGAHFEDRVMLLVFGKFNAGKSSLCNFLADRFRLHGQDVRFFRLEAGQLVYSDDGFHEGATETTASMQGVLLGQRLVLLDTPGLHSTRADNGALARSFLDSADAVLWLTNSASPGQVQELEELMRELRRDKPLLPIVTRSDYLEEDEQDGAIIKLLRNKTPANRALQESDVEQRAHDKLREMGVDEALLRPPVSVSVHAVRAHGLTQDALAAAGFERLFSALSALVQPALAYKQRKPAQTYLHHLNEHVADALRAGTLPHLQALELALQAEMQRLEDAQERIVRNAWREVVPELPRILEQHAAQRNIEGVVEAVAQLTTQSLERQVRAQLPDYALPSIVAAQCERAGQAWQEDSMDEAGELLDYEALHAALVRSVHEQLVQRSTGVVKGCAGILAKLQDSAQHMQRSMLEHLDHLPQLRRMVQAGAVAEHALEQAPAR